MTPRIYFDKDSYCCPGNWRRIVAELPAMIYYRSADGGTTWQDVGTPVQRYDGSTGWKAHAIDLSAYASQTDLRLGFLGISGFGNDLHLDNIRLGAGCTPQAGGLVMGSVFDDNTDLALSNEN